MKTASIPAIRVEPELRQELEALLADGETLSEFVESSVRAQLARRRNQAEFLARGMAAIERTKLSGDGIPAETVVRKLQAKLDAAKALKAARTR